MTTGQVPKKNPHPPKGAGVTTAGPVALAKLQHLCQAGGRQFGTLGRNLAGLLGCLLGLGLGGSLGGSLQGLGALGRDGEAEPCSAVVVLGLMALDESLTFQAVGVAGTLATVGSHHAGQPLQDARGNPDVIVGHVALGLGHCGQDSNLTARESSNLGASGLAGLAAGLGAGLLGVLLGSLLGSLHSLLLATLGGFGNLTGGTLPRLQQQSAGHSLHIEETLICTGGNLLGSQLRRTGPTQHTVSGQVVMSGLAGCRVVDPSGRNAVGVGAGRGAGVDGAVLGGYGVGFLGHGCLLRLRGPCECHKRTIPVIGKQHKPPAPVLASLL